MKIKKLALLIAFFCLSASFVFSQSRRPAQADESKKANRRPAETSAPKKNSTDVQQSEETVPEDAVVDDTDEVEVSTEIVTFPFKVTDRKGKFVAGLTKENFKVFEDEKEEPIEFFNNEQQPFTVALVLDMSYSATFKINEIQAAAMAFIDQLRKDDKVMVVSFSEDVIVGTEPTDDRQRIYDAIKKTKIASGTSLYEAVDVVVNKKLKKINGRKAIVLFTDGVDTTSLRATSFSNLRDVFETDILVYPISYDTFADVQRMKDQTVITPPSTQQTVPLPHPLPGSTPNPLPFPIPTSGGVGGSVGTPSGQGTSAEDYRKAEEYLNDISNRTGGRLYQANTTGNLERAFSSIAAELREFYSLGYYLPENARQGETRKVKIKVDKENLAIKSRGSYVVGKKAVKVVK